MPANKPNTTDATNGGPAPSPGADAGAVTLGNDPTLSEAVQNAVVEAMDRHGYGKASRFAVRLALAEAIANAFHHGHRGLPAGTTIGVEYRVNGSTVWIAVEDQGPGFDPAKVPDPTLDENLEQPSGRGLMLIRAYMTRVAHAGRGNRLEMAYDKPAG
ncbi:MAG: ATP-binding protein [Phycisphaeraceae bacterium]|nr:MAG: ATP-binding protein [Phycisphaeraceae bacterium]